MIRLGLAVFMLISVPFLALGQTYEFAGRVLDESNGKPVSNQVVLVHIKNTAVLYTTLTNENGRYRIYTEDLSELTSDTFIVSTYSYCENTEIVYSKYIKPSNTFVQTDFNICRDINKDCFADFSYYEGEDRKVYFFGYFSEKANVKWEFGDGSHSNDHQVFHLFAENTSYEVSLTVETEHCRQTYTRLLDFNDSFKFSGTVYAGSNELDEGHILLMQESDNKAVTNIMHVQSVNNGGFSFNRLNRGDYLLYVIPEKEIYPYVYPVYMPTYSGDVIDWENARSVKCDQNTSGYGIHLIDYPFPYYGSCNISGTLELGSEQSFEGFVIYLLNKDHEPINYTIPNPYSGYFAFSDLPEGTYFIKPERAGIHSFEKKITLSQDVSTQEDLDYIVDEGELKEKTEQDPEIPDYNFAFYMRHNTIYISGQDLPEAPVVCELYDVLGRTVIQERDKGPRVELDVNNIKTGVYLLVMKSYTGESLYQRKVFLSN